MISKDKIASVCEIWNQSIQHLHTRKIRRPLGRGRESKGEEERERERGRGSSVGKGRRRKRKKKGGQKNEREGVLERKG